ncbi:MAG: DUF4339 domain-containing protein [Lentisphaerae bacterium]|nr:DUF4339 domain-containing protein [Lentisphaerota bacterium]
MQWYYFARGKQVGPITEDALFQAVRDGLLAPSDFVWNTGMGSAWAQAHTVPGLFAPPPIQPDVVPPSGGEPVVVSSEFCADSGPRSCSDCAGLAWERTKDILFRPFNLGKWFALGFSAWLATLGEQGGSFNPGGGKWQESMAAESGGDPAAYLAQLWQKVVEHAPLIIGITSIVVLVSVAIGLVLLWVRCRGKFMFLDNIVHDRMEVAAPWHAYRKHGNSLFQWTIVYTLVGLAIVAILIGVGVFSLAIPYLRDQTLSGLWPTLTANLLLWIVVSCVFLYIGRFLEDFIVPIMYNENLGAAPAWARFLRVLGNHTWAFIGYGIYYLLLYLLAGVCVLALVIMTCCVAGCLLIIPYVGTVVMLPVAVFFRCFSLAYLAQFGAEFRQP